MSKKFLTPKIASDWWRICTMPDLGDIHNPDTDQQNIVDHHMYLAPDNQWRLWAAIRGTLSGHVIYSWKGASLETTQWEPQGIVLKSEKLFGERITPKHIVCAPFFIKAQNKYFCFYNSNGIHRLGSEDGINFKRILNKQGSSLSHEGGRDPMIMKFEGRYYAYSCVTTVSQDNWKKSFIIVRTSTDLEEWSDYTIVSEGGKAGNGPVSAESPFVTQIAGYFYLFRASSISFETYVYRSETPYHFGINEDSKLIATLPIKAPEIIEYGGQHYISDLADFQGIKLAKLDWV